MPQESKLCDQLVEQHQSGRKQLAWLRVSHDAPDDVEKQACLTREEIVNYLKGTGYGWHISSLLIYDRPRELTEFRRACPNSWYCESCAMYWENNGTCGNESLYIKRPPQSWCYVEGLQTK